MIENIDKVVLPGDIIWKSDSDVKEKEAFMLGPGLRRDSGNIIAFKAGILRTSKQTLWVDYNQRRYVPTKGDNVIGIITKSGSESFRVDIGSSMPAALGNLSFEGATKRNKPDLKIGDLVYAKLAIANKDMEPELTCVESGGKSKGLGPLNGGFMITVSLGLTRRLLHPEFILLQLIGKAFPFEITVGLNGRIWMNSREVMNTITLSNAIINSEFLSNDEIKPYVTKLLNKMQGF